MYKVLRIATMFNQWQSTGECINWFNNIQNQGGGTILKYNIKDFYSSILCETLNKAINFSK